jgi:hypothetical protein
MLYGWKKGVWGTSLDDRIDDLIDERSFWIR